MFTIAGTITADVHNEVLRLAPSDSTLEGMPRHANLSRLAPRNRQKRRSDDPKDVNFLVSVQLIRI